MREQFVPENVAFDLKNAGYDERSYGRYFNGKLSFHLAKIFEPNSEVNASDMANAPLWDQVIDWLDSKGKIISVKPTTRSGSIRYIYSISVALVKLNDGAIITQMSVDSYATRAEAREQAIIKALTLIK